MSKKLVRFLILILVISMPLSAYANEAQALVNKLYTASGQLPINDLVADVEIYSPISSNDAKSSLQLGSKDKIIFKKPSKLKIISILNDPGSSLDGFQMIIIRDGSQRWLFVPQGQWPVKKGPDEQSPTLNLPPNLQVYPHEVDSKYSVIGAQTIDGVPTKIVRIFNQGKNETVKIWIEPSKCIPIKQERETPDSADPKTMVKKVCNYGDFRKLKDGRWFPFKIEIYKGDKLDRLVVIKALSVNSGIEDDIFEPMKKYVR